MRVILRRQSGRSGVANVNEFVRHAPLTELGYSAAMSAPANPVGSTVEKRAHRREPVRRPAYLVSGGLAIKCVLVDIAPGGARIRLPAAALGTEDLYLADTRAGLVHLTHIVWRSSKEAGLQFVETASLPAAGGGVTAALKGAAALARSRAAP